MGFEPQVSRAVAARVTGTSQSLPSHSPDLHTASWSQGAFRPHPRQSRSRLAPSHSVCGSCLCGPPPRCPPLPAARGRWGGRPARPCGPGCWVESSLRHAQAVRFWAAGTTALSPAMDARGSRTSLRLSRAARQHPSPCGRVPAMQSGLEWRGVCLGKVLDLAGSPSLSSPSLGHLLSRGLEGGPAEALQSEPPRGCQWGGCPHGAGRAVPSTCLGRLPGAAGSGAAFPGARKEAGWG